MRRSGRHAARPGAATRQPAADFGSPRLPGQPVLPGAQPPLDDAVVFNRRGVAPTSGWRKVVYSASAGRINVGPSARERELAALHDHISRPIDGHFRIAVLSIKGGVGKTTTTLGLGSVFATARRDRVIAVDANPDRGTLAQRVQQHSPGSVSSLLASRTVQRYSDVRAFTRASSSRLEVLANDPDPHIADAFSESDYRRVLAVLQDYYSVVLSDCGTGILHSATAGVLALADAVVVASSPSLDAVKSAAATLDWLTLHGHSRLARESHLVISAARPGASTLQLDKVHDHFRSRCRSIHRIPFDPHLCEGGEVDMTLLRSSTQHAYLQLAAAIADKFTATRQHAVAW